VRPQHPRWQGADTPVHLYQTILRIAHCLAQVLARPPPMIACGHGVLDLHSSASGCSRSLLEQRRPLGLQQPPVVRHAVRQRRHRLTAVLRVLADPAQQLRVRVDVERLRIGNRIGHVMCCSSESPRCDTPNTKELRMQAPGCWAIKQHGFLMRLFGVSCSASHTQSSTLYNVHGRVP
jgi:hypothetical protein